MTEQTAEQTAEPTQPQGGEQASATQTETSPPWGDAANFQPEKAWSTIQTLREELRVAKGDAPEDLRAELAEFRKLRANGNVSDMKRKLAEYDRLVEASKTELEKAQEAAGKVPELEAQNRRLQVALEKDMTGAKAGLITRLQGETKEELAADADQLLSMFTSSAEPGTQQAQAPKPNPAQGSSAGGAPSAAEEAAQAAASGNWRESIRLKSQQLAALREQGSE